MNLPNEVILPLMSIALPLLGGWVWKMQNTVTIHTEVLEKHDEIMKKLDELITILLKDRLSK